MHLLKMLSKPEAVIEIAEKILLSANRWSDDTLDEEDIVQTKIWKAEAYLELGDWDNAFMVYNEVCQDKMIQKTIQKMDTANFWMLKGAGRSFCKGADKTFSDMVEKARYDRQWHNAEVFEDLRKAGIASVAEWDNTTDQKDYDSLFWIMIGMSKAAYKMDKYDKAIDTGTNAMKMSRAFPGVHKYVALAHKAKGDIDAAIRIVSQAILYEERWNVENLEQNKHILREMQHM